MLAKEWGLVSLSGEVFSAETGIYSRYKKKNDDGSILPN